MIFGFTEVLFQQSRNQMKNFGKLLVGQSLDQLGHQRIVGEFLQIADDRAFVDLSIQPETDQPIVGFYEMMCMQRHGSSPAGHRSNLDVVLFVKDTIMKKSAAVKQTGGALRLEKDAEIRYDSHRFCNRRGTPYEWVSPETADYRREPPAL
jgi:hypothetical protein